MLNRIEVFSYSMGTNLGTFYNFASKICSQDAENVYRECSQNV